MKIFQYLFIFISLHFFYTTLIRHSVFMSLETCNFPFFYFLSLPCFPFEKNRKKRNTKSKISKEKFDLI